MVVIVIRWIAFKISILNFRKQEYAKKKPKTQKYIVMATILITGGTGLVGQALIPRLLDKGHVVHALSRSERNSDKKNLHYFKWDVGTGSIELAALDNIDGVIHLAGAGIADKRWTPARKRVIIDSRVESANLIKNELSKRAQAPLSFFITASGSNYYGTETKEHIYTEADPPGNDFLAHCCMLWEAAAFKDNSAQRVVAIRTAMVLSETGGALSKLAMPIKYGAGAAFGSGKQYTPWIHLDDLVESYFWAVENEVSGAFNAVADEHLNNAELTRAIAEAYNRKVWLPNIPGFVLRLALGNISSMLLKGSRLSNQQLTAAGFALQYPTIKKALADLIKTP